MDAVDVILGEAAQLGGLGRGAEADLLDVGFGRGIDLGGDALAFALGGAAHREREFAQEPPRRIGPAVGVWCGVSRRRSSAASDRGI